MLLVFEKFVFENKLLDGEFSQCNHVTKISYIVGKSMSI